MALLLHYTGQDYISRGLLNTELTPGSTSAIVGGCKTGKGFAFDGTGNSALSSQLDEERTIHSFSVWFKIINIDSTRFIAAFGEVNFLQFMLWQRPSGEFVFGYCNNEGIQKNIILNSDLPRGVWYHFAASINGLEMKLYLNGSLIKTHTARSIRKGSDKFLKLGIGTTLACLLGQICNFKYYNHVLSAREIAEDYKSLILHYKLDKHITDTVFDHSGFNRHITNLTNNTVTLDSKSQVYSASLKNDGTQALMGDCDLTDLNGLDEFTVSYWQMVSGTGYQFVISNDKIYTDPLTTYFGFYHTETGTPWLQYSFCKKKANITVAAWIPNSWYRITLTKTSTHIRIYRDKTLIYTTATTNQVSNFTDKLVIASGYNGSSSYNRLNGNVQDIRFYATALTQAEVTELYQTRHMVDKDSNCYTYELIEGQTTVGMNKQGQLLCDEVIENEDGTFQIVSNKTIKTKEIKEI